MGSLSRMAADLSICAQCRHRQHVARLQHRKILSRGVIRNPIIHGDWRDGDFKKDLLARSDALKQVIDQEDHVAAIEAELDLHGLVYEHVNNRILLNSWTGLRGHLQLYRAAHGTTVPKRDSHDDYLRFALGDSLSAMKDERRDHMRLGLETTKALVEARSAAIGIGAPQWRPVRQTVLI